MNEHIKLSAIFFPKPNLEKEGEVFIKEMMRSISFAHDSEYWKRRAESFISYGYIVIELKARGDTVKKYLPVKNFLEGYKQALVEQKGYEQQKAEQLLEPSNLNEKLILASWLIKEMKEINIVIPKLAHDECLIISSNDDRFLHLFWEKEFNNTIILREVESNISTTSFDNINMAIATSYARFYSGGSYSSISESILSELNNIISVVYGEVCFEKDCLTQKFSKITLYKHLTQQVFKDLLCSRFNMLHIISHGSSEGDIELENEGNSSQGSSFLRTDMMESFKDKNSRFKLIFLSLCHGCSGIRNNKTLAFELVEKGYANHVIGYLSGVRTDSVAPKLAKDYYEYLFNRDAPLNFAEAFIKTKVKNREVSNFVCYRIRGE